MARIWTHPENRGRRVRALARYAGWQVWERTVRRPWDVPLPGGLKVRCHPHSTVASAVLYYGLPDPAEMRFVMAYLDEGDEFVDVGANVGVYSLLACTVPGVRALALEPSEPAATRAAENLELNGLQDRVALVRAAAGDHEGVARLTAGRDAMNALVEAGGETGETEEVPLRTLDALAAEHGFGKVALVKVDVEGWEAEVLAGASGLLSHRRPALIVEANDPAALEAVRERHGYHWARFDPASRRLAPAELPAPGENAILVPDLEAAAARLRR